MILSMEGNVKWNLHSLCSEALKRGICSLG